MAVACTRLWPDTRAHLYGMCQPTSLPCPPLRSSSRCGRRTCSWTVCRASPHRARRPPAVSKIPRRGYQWLRRECGSVSIVMRAGVPDGKRIRVMRAQIIAVLDGCQLFFSGHKLEGGTTHETLLFLKEKALEQILRMVSFLWSGRWACGQDLITDAM
jgi:hypothetical protein